MRLPVDTHLPTGTAPTVPVGPMLSMYDPIFTGIDEMRAPVYLPMAYRNILAAGEPGGGKSGLLQTIASHAALADRTRLVLLDGKQVELGLYAPVADKFVGPDIADAIITLRRLQEMMNRRYTWLLRHGRRKIEPGDDVNTIVVIIDEIAYFSATVGTPQQQQEFIALLRDLVARGRACGVIVIAATQRPSVDIIPKSMRDLFSYRAAFRCTSTGSSDIILGDGWSGAGYTATDIAPTSQGVCYLIAEGGLPRLIKVAYLTDDHIGHIVDHALWTRDRHRPHGSTTPAAQGLAA
ncbi:FtsK/SpoIIIE domain-containing protein [Actinomadura sp. 6N118]|uniref:FtsK/SpoIIIE domain-containing protein n=1 Tax=Actinomadura sp. 6N118 TaxID=3375151 RepID=UPI0037B0E81B